MKKTILDLVTEYGTHQALADALGVSREMVTKVVNGQRRLGLDALLRARALGLDVDAEMSRCADAA